MEIHLEPSLDASKLKLSLAAIWILVTNGFTFVDCTFHFSTNDVNCFNYHNHTYPNQTTNYSDLVLWICFWQICLTDSFVVKKRVIFLKLASLILWKIVPNQIWYTVCKGKDAIPNESNYRFVNVHPSMNSSPTEVQCVNSKYDIRQFTIWS